MTIVESKAGINKDSYELFWDDGDRLVATTITFATSRLCGSHTLGAHGGTVATTCTGIRWHYQYLGNRLIAATREMVSTSQSSWIYEPLKRFWAASDERGLIYRMVDGGGNTYWQSRWDASGWRNWVGTPQPEMWVPFGLPGQIVLDKNVIYDHLDSSGTPITIQTWGTQAYASGTGGTWTRPAIALNRLRGYDPLFGSFLQPDQLDRLAREAPEGYQAFRNNPISFTDTTGSSSAPLNDYLLGLSLPGATFAGNCNGVEQTAILTALGQAYRMLSSCTSGVCGNATIKRNLLYDLSRAQFDCNSSSWMSMANDGFLAHRRAWPFDEEVQAEGTAFASTIVERGLWRTETAVALTPQALSPDAVSGETPTCLAETLAHEATHAVFRRVPAWLSGTHSDDHPERDAIDYGVFENPGWFPSVSEIREQNHGSEGAQVREEVIVRSNVQQCEICND